MARVSDEKSTGTEDIRRTIAASYEVAIGERTSNSIRARIRSRKAQRATSCGWDNVVRSEPAINSSLELLRWWATDRNVAAQKAGSLIHEPTRYRRQGRRCAI